MTEIELKRNYMVLMSKVCAFSIERAMEKIINQNPTMIGIEFKDVEALENQLAAVDRTLRLISKQLDIKMTL